MFLITPIFLWLYLKNKKKAKLALLILISASLTLGLIIAYDLEVKANPPTKGGVSNESDFVWFYIKPYVRLPPYFLGVLFGLLYKEYKDGYGFMAKFGHACLNSKGLRTFL